MQASRHPLRIAAAIVASLLCFATAAADAAERQRVGLVLAGGGARGAAHAGVYRALVERGMPIDVIGGTSMGAVFGAVMAFDASPQVVIETFAEHFVANPTGDYNLLPILSLIKGRRLRGMMERTEKAISGNADLGIEDLWKTYYCVATNYSQAREQVLRSGPLVNAVMASCAIPGALPPVLHDGDLLCDGGMFNNFPADVMRAAWGVGRVIGVDISFETSRRIELQALPGPWEHLRDLLRPRDQRRYGLPSLTHYLMNVTSLYSTARQDASRDLTDLYIKPALAKVGMLQWDSYAKTVQQGYEQALQVVDGEAAQRLGIAPASPPSAG